MGGDQRKDFLFVVWLVCPEQNPIHTSFSSKGFVPRHQRRLGMQGHSKASARGHTPDSATTAPEWGPGMDSTVINWRMFQNKGFGPSGHCHAVFMEQAGCHGNRQATGIRAALHPLSLWIRISFCARPFLSPPQKPSLPQASVGIVSSHFRGLAPTSWLHLESCLQNPGRQESIGLCGSTSDPIS